MQSRVAETESKINVIKQIKLIIMTVYCTRRIISIKTRKRLFMIFDQDKPFVATIKYKKMVPLLPSDTKTLNLRILDLHETHKFKCGFCINCGDLGNCKYLNPEL